MSSSVAIVGAGGAGAGTAYALREEDITTTIFEKSGNVSGRAAVREKNGCLYEYGANYLKPDDDRVTEILTEQLDTAGLIDIDAPVWTFDNSGTIREGDDTESHKWTYVSGLAELPRRLIDATDATLYRRRRVETLSRDGDCWRIEDNEGERWGPFDAVVLTPPAPQSADLLGQAAWEHGNCRWLREAIERVPYRTILSVVLHYPFELDLPYYALVNDDSGDHPIGWIAREECKASRVPDGESVLLVQMSPAWSVDHYHDETALLVDAVTESTAALLDDERLLSPDWTDHQRWRYALPDTSPTPDALTTAASHDLYLAGDWVTGEARLHAAIRSGLEAADAIRGDL
jgi:predicted NAD/FAD-dependent oxidoreductase